MIEKILDTLTYMVFENPIWIVDLMLISVAVGLTIYVL